MKKSVFFKQSLFKGSVFCKKLTDIKNIREKMLIILVFTAMTAFLYFSEIGCIWQFFFGIPCPGCGITRAYLAFFSGNIFAAFRYNFMFPAVPVIFLYIVFDGRIFKSKISDRFILLFLAAGFLISWLIKII